ncbi:MAG: acyltransferase [Lachnospiraceae bacterium]|nr:acyltransferase [Lachnospiraceae bacterium]
MDREFTKEHSAAVRGVAILLLLFYHLFHEEQTVLSMGVDYSPLSMSTLLTVSGFGNVCVAVFVFLSGYGIAKGILKQEHPDARMVYGQATARFFKLMLNFLTMYLSVNLIWWSCFDYASLYGEGKQGALCMLTDALGLSDFFGTPTLNITWWYMSLAYMLIFLIPVLTWLVKKIGYPVLILVIMLPVAVQMEEGISRYLFTAALGVCAAYGGWLEKLMRLNMHLTLQWAAGIVGFFFCILLRSNYVVSEYYLQIVDAFIALFIIWFAGVLLCMVPVLGSVLRFIGKYSMNIYLVHTFFYLILWQRYIYQFRYMGLILLALLIASLAYSVVLECLKKALGFYRLTGRIQERLEKGI